MSNANVGFARRFARVAGLSWIIGLSIAAVGMACFWAQRDASGVFSLALKIGALLVPLALVTPAIVCQVASGVRMSAGTLGAAAAKALGVALLSLVLGLLLTYVEALRPEEAFAFLGETFAGGHAIAAAVPAVLALAAYTWSVWNSGRRIPVLGGLLGLAALGVAAWWWSTGIGYTAMRFSNIDASLLLAQAVVLAAVLASCLINAALCGRGKSGAPVAKGE